MARHSDTETRQTYLVEHYRPNLKAEELRSSAARVRDTAIAMEREGRAVRHVRSTIVPADECIFCIFEAESEGLVREAYGRAGVALERISVCEWAASHRDSQGAPVTVKPQRGITRGTMSNKLTRKGNVAVLAMLGLLAALGPAAKAHALPKERPIQPGAPLCLVGGPLDDGACGEWSTLNFVFKGAQGELYIGSVAHNFSGVDDRATIRGEPRPFGRVVVQDDSVDFLHPGDPPDLQATDFALIRINSSRYQDVEPSVRSFGGPTGYTTPAQTSTGDVIEAFGQGRPALSNPTGARSGRLLADSSRAFSSTVPESGGDSGMPYVHADTKKALGVNANCFCGVAPGLYPTVDHIIDRLAALGFNVKLVHSR